MLKDVVLRTKDKNIFNAKSEFSHVILSQDWDKWPCGAPLIADGKCIKSESVKVFSLFPSRSFINKMEDFSVVGESLVETTLKPLVETHRTISVDAFDCAKFERLKDYVKAMGGVTFVVKEEAARKDLVNVLKFFPKTFKYTSLFHYDKYGTKYLVGEDDDLLGVISFFNLPYCIPLFNLKKVDGMGVSYCQAPRKASEKANRLIRSYRIDIVLSNYMDNVFVIDGSDINPLNPVHGDIYNEVEKWTNEEMKVRSKMSGVESRPSVKGISIDNNGWVNTTATYSTSTYYGR